MHFLSFRCLHFHFISVGSDSVPSRRNTIGTEQISAIRSRALDFGAVSPASNRWYVRVVTPIAFAKSSCVFCLATP